MGSPNQKFKTIRVCCSMPSRAPGGRIYAGADVQKGAATISRLTHSHVWYLTLMPEVGWDLSSNCQQKHPLTQPLCVAACASSHHGGWAPKVSLPKEPSLESLMSWHLILSQPFQVQEEEHSLGLLMGEGSGLITRQACGMGDTTIFGKCSLSYSLFPLESVRRCTLSSLTFYAGSQDKSNLEATTTMESGSLLLSSFFSQLPSPEDSGICSQGTKSEAWVSQLPAPNWPQESSTHQVRTSSPLPQTDLLCHSQYNVLGGQNDLFYQ